MTKWSSNLIWTITTQQFESLIEFDKSVVGKRLDVQGDPPDTSNTNKFNNNNNVQ